jgi:hypothetical protein
MNTLTSIAHPAPSGAAPRAGRDIAIQIAESPSDGALWRAYMTSVLSKPIFREEEVRNEIQTAA